MSKTIWVRVSPASELTTRACVGVNWSKNWMRVDHFDTATINALEADQMLEVTEEDPANAGGAEDKGSADEGDAADGASKKPKKK